MRVRSIATIALALALAPFGLAGCAQPAASTTAASSTASTVNASNTATSDASTDNGSAGNASAASSASSTTSEAANPSPGASASSVAPTSPTGATEITADQAKEIALGHANLTEADVYDLKVELERDDNMPHYDVEFKQNNVEYDYEILLDGTILTASSEIDNNAAD